MFVGPLNMKGICISKTVSKHLFVSIYLLHDLIALEASPLHNLQSTEIRIVGMTFAKPGYVLILLTLHWLAIRCYCHKSSTLVCPEAPKGNPKKMPVCAQKSCDRNCTCVWGNCSQNCTAPSTCPLMDCDALGWCEQQGYIGATVGRLVCNATQECLQTLNHSAADFVVALAQRVTQVYKNHDHRLKEMTCSAADACTQSCDTCGSSSCNASHCQVACTDCAESFCTGSQACNHTCYKQCNYTHCSANRCNLTCAPGSKCNDVRCSDVDFCSLDCQDGATCSLNCSNAKICEQACALNGLCRTWAGKDLDTHDGQCQMCNCSQNVRHCIQRCETKSARCSEMQCRASSQCEQYSSTTRRSIVHSMMSTAPLMKQTCDNKSECWRMVCYGPNCTLICDHGASCGFMICEGDNCTFVCKNGATCDVMTCLPGANLCTYKCDASSNCRLKRCQGRVCVGAKPYTAATACHIQVRWAVLTMLLFVAVSII